MTLIQSFSNLSPGEAPSNSTSEVPKSRKTRKSAKPLKTQVSSATDEIEIQTFDKELPLDCDQCTFSCNSDKLLKQHLQEGHISPCGKASLFACKQCKTATDCKDMFSAHLSHHKGSHTLRCYLCPYCTTSSNSMDTIEDHVGEKHPSEVFRFEVLQEKIDYLQNMLTCPICNGGYIWQKPFISHLESVHQIIVDYLLTNYNEKSLPDKAKVPRSYFRNLLPDAPDYDMEHDHLGEGDPSNDENFQTLDGDEPRVTSILEAHLVGSGSQENSYSGMYAEGVEFSERFPPADLSQYVIKKGTPTTFSCDMCPFECVKTAHFRRHLEVHRRNEFMHNRLNCIRFHLGKYHRDEPYKTRIVDNSIISYGPEDDPTLGRSKAKKPFLTASTPNNEKEKRLPIKFETPETSQRRQNAERFLCRSVRFRASGPRDGKKRQRKKKRRPREANRFPILCWNSWRARRDLLATETFSTTPKRSPSSPEPISQTSSASSYPVAISTSARSANSYTGSLENILDVHKTNNCNLFCS